MWRWSLYVFLVVVADHFCVLFRSLILVADWTCRFFMELQSVRQRSLYFTPKSTYYDISFEQKNKKTKSKISITFKTEFF